ncbi:hypothetical protein L484_005252 [Morus notabilis]|uniref:Uncharacterized protein n=1 Tax=Morus notabilis TaxID=981085 RepID=W9SAU1_9ROSA|nr:hypothetical protein L484_005250 [Morus notabilis]EXC23302.1 hypothetical protein L484_005252 [Morus notabilis]
MGHFVIREEHYHAVREEQYEYYVAPPQDDSLKIMLENFGKRAEQNAFVDYQQRQKYNQQDCGYKGPYLHATVAQQQPATTHKVQTTFAPPKGHYQQPIAHKGPNYLRTGIAHQGHVQQPNEGSQLQGPPSKTHGGVMDCNEAAKLYGGVVITEYGRNKYTLRAN